MIAFVTSIGEPTTDISMWALKRQGFDVQLLQSSSSLWDKLKLISDIALGMDYVRVDADIIVNENIKDLIKETELWWYQTYTFDWWKQDITHGGVQFIRKEATPIIKKHIDEARYKERPESYLYRLEEFHNPRRCNTYETICGLNGYKQNDAERVKATKERRNQTGYDWELVEELNKL